MKLTAVIFSFAIAAVAVSACNNSDFNSQTRRKPDTQNKKIEANGKSGTSADGSGTSGSSSDASGSGDPGQLPPPSVAGARVAGFKYGSKATANDLLFIVDNSVSMNPHLTKVKEGFKRLNDADWFGDVRMAVMTTMPGDPANLNKVHAGVRDAVAENSANGNPYVGIELEPGFLSFVSAEAFQKYKQVGATFVSRYPEPLCSGDWFKPDAVNSKNERCLTVSLQNPLFAVGCEAGMTALSQILDKKGKIFRDGAYAQIIFVSDAQDPGCSDADLRSIRPKADVLRAKVLAKNQLAGLKFHGALPVPNGGETNEIKNNGPFGFPYNELIAADKGILIDITAGQDYSAFASGIAKSSVQEPVFSLATKASKINYVKVDGKQIAQDKIELAKDGLSVRIIGLNPNINVGIVIDFMPAP